MPQDTRHVIILLCTRNGENFLAAQLDSYLGQSHRNWSLWVSDDGSDDGTPALLEAFRARHGADHDIRILQGPETGRAADNFLSLLTHPDLPPGIVALSDQDDIWLAGKLARALKHLPQEAAQPMIYSAQSFYINARGVRRGGSRPPAAAPEFGTAMMQNVMAGHSMVLNPAAVALARQAGHVDIPYHDWWLSLLVAAAGGTNVLDRKRCILYRQHKHNVMGAPGGIIARLYRIGQVVSRSYGCWIAANARALEGVTPLLTSESRNRVQRFLSAPARYGLRRITLLRDLGLHRQSRPQTWIVYLAAALGRV
jgi:glycosyltransferase involved in cell wall biosynthesis